MTDTVDTLILELLEYVSGAERRYDDVMDAWHTSCPKLPIWEEANERGLITRTRVNGHAIVRITAAGAALLERRRRLLLH
jgi:DNA-binding PadR family transcriptional regulator